MVTSQKKKTVYRRRKTTKAADIMRPLMDRAIRSKGFVQTEVVSRWRDIVGNDLSKVTVPKALRFPRGERTGGTLYIRCESAFAPLLQHRTNHIMDLVNQYFGYRAVFKISVEQGPLPRSARTRQKKHHAITDDENKRLDNLLSNSGENDLKDALRRLGEQVYTRDED